MEARTHKRAARLPACNAWLTVLLWVWSLLRWMLCCAVRAIGTRSARCCAVCISARSCSSCRTAPPDRRPPGRSCTAKCRRRKEWRRCPLRPTTRSDTPQTSARPFGTDSCPPCVDETQAGHATGQRRRCWLSEATPIVHPMRDRSRLPSTATLHDSFQFSSFFFRRKSERTNEACARSTPEELQVKRASGSNDGCASVWGSGLRVGDVR